MVYTGKIPIMLFSNQKESIYGYVDSFLISLSTND